MSLMSQTALAAWLALGVSVAALLVSMLSLTVARTQRREAHSDVRGTAWLQPDDGKHGRAILQVRLANKGRGDMQLLEMSLPCRGLKAPDDRVDNYMLDGEPLPTVLVGLTTQTWRIDVTRFLLDKGIVDSEASEVPRLSFQRYLESFKVPVTVLLGDTRRLKVTNMLPVGFCREIFGFPQPPPKGSMVSVGSVRRAYASELWAQQLRRELVHQPNV